MKKLIGRVWMPVLIVTAVGAGAVTVAQLRTVFGSHPVVVTDLSSDNAEDFNPKFVTYEIFGTGSTAVINYMDLAGKPQRVPSAALPWTLTLETTLPSVMPNILAQSDGDSISCRVTVDDEVKQERTATGVNAETFCFVKAA
ncbi:MmpS family transport accessory protein [[Mycobacterium] nativiensis]|uniref:MmpS family transport accessory protein n=1 Tax=[Mycobacterium] nativiensis TaxID=2855503 RepID=A0ABU5XTR0_9MYCO|nr:MmpS family transport accessory protein [Mycolicibacter sp. MYC340]MEB3031367.1 MmpS family transport accessory protein [Mycolicibacter sp. MYC340]